MLFKLFCQFTFGRSPAKFSLISSFPRTNFSSSLGMDPGAKVLVTGASGYIAAHIIKILLESGYKVRGTVRDPTNAQKCKPIKDLVPSKVENLELVKADLTDSVEKWIPVVKDCKYVLHVASPFPHKEPRNPEEVIQPAVDGTLVVMKVKKSLISKTTYSIKMNLRLVHKIQ